MVTTRSQEHSLLETGTAIGGHESPGFNAERGRKNGVGGIGSKATSKATSPAAMTEIEVDGTSQHTHPTQEVSVIIDNDEEHDLPETDASSNSRGLLEDNAKRKGNGGTKEVEAGRVNTVPDPLGTTASGLDGTGEHTRSHQSIQIVIERTHHFTADPSIESIDADVMMHGRPPESKAKPRETSGIETSDNHARSSKRAIAKANTRPSDSGSQATPIEISDESEDRSASTLKANMEPQETGSQASLIEISDAPGEQATSVARPEVGPQEGSSQASSIKIPDAPKTRSAPEASTNFALADRTKTSSQLVRNASPSASIRFSESTAQRKKGLAEKKSKKHEDTEVTSNQEQVSDIVQSKHMRFGDDEPVPIVAGAAKPKVSQEAVRQALDQQTGLEGLTDRESDDDAPEEVTAASGEQKAKAAASSAAKAIKKQAEDDKTRRRKRDQDLKEQAKASKKRKLSENKKLVESTDDASEQQATSPTLDSTSALIRSLLNSDKPLPATLPDEIFAVPRKARPSTSPPITLLQKPRKADPVQQTKSKRKRLDNEMRPIKDIKHGNTYVRVLQQHSSALPPPVVKSSAHIREGWLKGRRKVEVPGYRQKGARSFLRK